MCFEPEKILRYKLSHPRGWFFCKERRTPESGVRSWMGGSCSVPLKGGVCGSEVVGRGLGVCGAEDVGAHHQHHPVGHCGASTQQVVLQTLRHMEDPGGLVDAVTAEGDPRSFDHLTQGRGIVSRFDDREHTDWSRVDECLDGDVESLVISWCGALEPRLIETDQHSWCVGHEFKHRNVTTFVHVAVWLNCTGGQKGSQYGVC